MSTFNRKRRRKERLKLLFRAIDLSTEAFDEKDMYKRNLSDLLMVEYKKLVKKHKK